MSFAAARETRAFEEHRASLRARYAGMVASEYTEVRLGPSGSRQCDFLFSVLRSQATELFEAARTEPCLAPLLQAWARRGSGLHEAVPLMWLEYDAVEREPSTPSVSVCVAPGYSNPAATIAEQDRASLTDLLEEVVRLTVGSSQRYARALAEFVETVPSDGRVIHVSVMTGRRPCPVKLYCVAPRAGLLPWLDALGWRGPRGRVEELVETLFPVSRAGPELYVDFTLDELGEAGGGRLGLAFAQQQLERSQEGDPRRGALLEALVGAGLCTPDERKVLSRWPDRRIRGGGEPGGWPRLEERWLDIKLVWSRDAPLLAKAYLGSASRPAMLFDGAGFAQASAS